MQRDALARSYMLDALDSSVDVVNEGIKALRRVSPTPLVHAHLRRNKVLDHANCLASTLPLSTSSSVFV
jgi:hypothetical protein